MKQDSPTLLFYLPLSVPRMSVMINHDAFDLGQSSAAITFLDYPQGLSMQYPVSSRHEHQTTLRRFGD